MANISSLPNYKYAQLPGDEQGHHIRLLKVHPASLDAPITSSLEVHGLNGNVLAYTALSYSWGRNRDGDASLSHELVVDGCILPITENLHDGLQRLRSLNGDALVIWIDAVCINQADIKERNAQVAIMASIYRSASQLVVWLGEDSETDAAAMEMLDIARSLNLFRFEPKKANTGLECLDPGKAHKDVSPARVSAFRLGATELKRLIEDHDEDRLSDSRGKLRILGALSARRVRFGLGETDDYTSLQQATSGKLCLDIVDQAIRFPLFHDALGSTYLLKLTTIHIAKLHPVKALFGRRYFSRRWVLQEIIESRTNTCYVHWGPFKLRLAEFIDRGSRVNTALPLGMLTAHAHARKPDYDFKEFQEFKQLCNATSEAWENAFGILNALHGVDPSKTDLAEAMAKWNFDDESPPSRFNAIKLAPAPRILACLALFNDLKCSDPRDRIFAFGSMADGLKMIAPDYNRSVTSTYIAFAQSLIRNGHLRFVLHAAAWQKGLTATKASSSLDLPSWVPNLILPLAEKSLRNYQQAMLDHHRPSEKNSNAKVTSDGALQLKAILGKVVGINRSWDPDVPPAEPNAVAGRTRFQSGQEFELKPYRALSIEPDDRICVIPKSGGYQFDLFALRPIPSKRHCFTLVGGRRNDPGSKPPRGYGTKFHNSVHLPDEHAESIWIY